MAKGDLIETGVDKLLALIEERNRISLSEAAKTLSVPKPVVEEWVNFLEEKELIQIQYKFTTPYLMKKQVSEEVIQERVKEFSGRKEGFVRQVESTLALLETETMGLKHAESNFKEFAASIEADFSKVKKEMETLEKYDQEKKKIDSDVVKEQAAFEQKIRELKDEVELKQSKYALLEKHIDEEEQTLDKEKSRADAIMRKEKELLAKLNEIKESIVNLGDALSSEDNVIKLEENHITKLHNNAEGLRAELRARKDSIQQMVDESKRKEQAILSTQKEIMEKIADEAGKIHGKVEMSKQTKQEFADFFQKKVKMDIMMDKVTHDLGNLEHELKGLINEAQAVDFSQKKTNAKEHAKKLEREFQDIKKKKDTFFGEIGKLHGLMKNLQRKGPDPKIPKPRVPAPKKAKRSKTVTKAKKKR